MDNANQKISRYVILILYVRIFQTTKKTQDNYYLNHCIQRYSSYNSFKSLVILSIIVDGAGPIPRHVMVPVGIWVNPLSCTWTTGRPEICAFLLMLFRSSREWTLTTIFAWPELNHFINHEGLLVITCSAPDTAAWATWADSFPMPIRSSFLTTITCLNSNNSYDLSLINKSRYLFPLRGIEPNQVWRSSSRRKSFWTIDSSRDRFKVVDFS